MNSNKYYNFAKNELFPICRSITGKGTEQTLKKIQRFFPKLKIYKIKSGTKIFDWKIPEEWNIKNAYVIDKYQNKIIDFKKNNLHIVGYSKPIKKKLTKKELLNKIYSLPAQSDAIPYVTSYYKKDWGFCTTDIVRKLIVKNYSKNDKFDVLIDTSFKKNGYLQYGEYFIKGKTSKEIIISTYICHPSMANNELSGPIVSMSLMDYFSKLPKPNKSLRFVFIPETIGSLAFLNNNLKKLKKNFLAGFNLTCIGDERMYSCMLSKYEDSISDDAIIKAYKKLKLKFKKYSFLKRASDERQYNSPGIDLPFTSVFRSKYHEYPEYHTSKDDFKIVTKKGIKGSFKLLKLAIKIIQQNIYPITKVLGEPMLSKRGLYSTISLKNSWKSSRSYLDVLQFSDGRNNLDKISELSKIDVKKLKKVIKTLNNYNLIDV
jgi:aminopeptidase-like protein